MAQLALAAMLGSAAVGAVGAVRSGNMQQASAEAEAQRMNAAADVARRDGAAEDERFRTDARRQLGLQLAASAEAGAGLNADQLRQSIYDMEMDSSSIRYGVMSRASGLNDQANIRLREGREARTAGYLNAAGTLLNAASTAGSYYGKKPVKGGG
jgi:hypothetical protein